MTEKEFKINENALFPIRQEEEKEFNLSDEIFGVNEKGLPLRNERDFIKVLDVIKMNKEFIKIIEMDLLKKYKRASIPIMEIIKKRAGDKLK